MDIKKNIEVKAGKSKHYYETDRNLDNTKQMNKQDERVPEYYRMFN